MREEGAGHAPVLPASLIIVLLAGIGGFAYYNQTLESARPQVARGQTQHPFGTEQYDARLWQDPFESIYQLNANDARDDSVETSQLRDDILHHLASSATTSTLMIMPVVVKGGDFPEDRESRRRQRHAVVSALGIGGFAPAQGNLIGVLHTSWKPPSATPGGASHEALPALIVDRKSPETDNHALYIPFEWFQPHLLAGAPSESARTRAVVVLWIDEDVVAEYLPLMVNQLLYNLLQFQEEELTRHQLERNERLASPARLLQKTDAGGTADPIVEVAVIGPATSDGLLGMRNELVQWVDWQSVVTNTIRDHVPEIPTIEQEQRLQAMVGEVVRDFGSRAAFYRDLDSLPSTLKKVFQSGGIPSARYVDVAVALREAIEAPVIEMLEQMLGGVDPLSLLHPTMIADSVEEILRVRLSEDQRTALAESLHEPLEVRIGQVLPGTDPSVIQQLRQKFIDPVEEVSNALMQEREFPPVLPRLQKLGVAQVGSAADLREIHQWLHSSFATRVTLEKWRSPALRQYISLAPSVRYYSTRASVPEYLFHAGEEASLLTIPQEDRVDAALGGNGVFNRLTLPDSKLARALIEELDGRNVDLTISNTSDLILLVSEWDTFYGRAFPQAFCQQLEEYWKRRTIAESESEYKPEFQAKIREKVFEVSYLRGLDGEIPGERKPQAPERRESERATEKLVPAYEEAYGPAQLDYVRRIAQRLRTMQTSHESTKRFVAIGVVGSDIYDKLLILQALRRQYPQAVFFTTDYDEQLLQHDRWCRNLVIASTFGSHLAPELQKNIPPFRSTYQTSTYLAVQLALGGDCIALDQHKIKTTEVKDYLHPRIYEVGRTGAYDITPREKVGAAQKSTPSQGKPAQVTANGDKTVAAEGSARYWYALDWRNLSTTLALFVGSTVVVLLPFHERLRRLSRPTGRPFGPSSWRLLAIAVLLAAVITVAYVGRPAETLPQQRLAYDALYPSTWHAKHWGDVAAKLLLLFGGVSILLPMFNDQCRRFWTGSLDSVKWWTHYFVLIVMPTVLILFVAFMHWAAQQPGQEPLRYFEGISMWPCELVRVFLVLLTVAFFARGYLRLKENQLDIEKRFFANQHDGEGGRSPERTDRSVSSSAFFNWNDQYWRWVNEHQDPRKEADNRIGMDQWVWQKYKQLSSPKSRFLRFRLVGALLLLMGLIFMLLLNLPFRPVRGTMILIVDWALLILSVGALLAITAATVDAHRLCHLLVCWIGDKEVRWSNDAAGPRTVRGNKAGAADRERALEDLDRMNVIAERTRAVSALVWYPFVILVLMLFSRNSYFDNFDWPPALIAIYVLLTLVVLLSAIRLRRAAADVKEDILRRFIDYIRITPSQDNERDNLILLREEIERERRGAFGSLTDQPVLRAILLPFGGLGVYAALEILSAFGL